MAGLRFTRTDMRAKARQRADMVGSNFVSDGEVDDYLEKYLKRLWMHLVSKHDDIFIRRATFQCTASQEYVRIIDSTMTNVWALRDIQIADAAAGPFSRLRRVPITDLENYSSRTSTAKPVYYCTRRDWGTVGTDGVVPLQEEFLHLRPVPDQAYWLQVYYVATPPELAELDDAGGTYNPDMPFMVMLGDYCVTGAAIEMRDKEESDTSVLERDLARFEEEIHRCFPTIDQNEPSQVVQHTRAFLEDPEELSGLTLSFW